MNWIAVGWDSPPEPVLTPTSFVIVSSDTDDGVMDGRRNGSAPMPFSKELAAERVSECYTSQNMNVPVAR